MAFVVDDLSNWYVRQSRARFYEVETDENRAAFATLHECLVVTARLLAPDRAVPHRLDAPAADGNFGAPRRLCAASPTARCRGTRGWSAAWPRCGNWRRWGARRVRRPGSTCGSRSARVVCVVPHERGRRCGTVAHPVTIRAEREGGRARDLGRRSGDARGEAEFPVVRQEVRQGDAAGGEGGAGAHAAITCGASSRARRWHSSVEGETHTLDAEDLTILRRASGAAGRARRRWADSRRIDPTLTPALRAGGDGSGGRQSGTTPAQGARARGLRIAIALALWGAEEIEAVSASIRSGSRAKCSPDPSRWDVTEQRENMRRTRWRSMDSPCTSP